MIWNNEKECMSRDEISFLQNQKIIEMVDYVYHNVAFYRQKMQTLGIECGDIKGIEDITKLPYMTKDDLRQNYPFGLFAVPQSQIIRIHASSGTSGKATIVGYTKNDILAWQECVARVLTMANISKNNKIQIAYGYGLFTGGLGIHYGAENLGATVIPNSTGNTKKLITMMIDFGVQAIACTPSYLLHITEILENMNVVNKIKLHSAICGAEPWTENMRKEIEKRLSLTCHDIYGLSEIMGPGVAADCQFHNGLHIWEDYFLPEIINQDTLTPISDGKTGELVITTLSKQALPLLRYRTKDLTSITHKKCKCGRTAARLSKFKGRSDDMLIIRGVNVFPSQIETVLLEINDISPYYLIIVDNINNHDTLQVVIEVTDKFLFENNNALKILTNKISDIIHQAIGLVVNVKLVEPNTLERSKGKSKKVIDNRKLL